MELLETSRRLARRWYILIPGIVLAIAASVATWTVVQPEYERSATQLLVPGEGTLPRDASNPFLYLGGLTSVADVIVRAAGSTDSVRGLTREYPDAKVEVSRDPLNAGPAILATVTAPTDEAAKSIIDAFVRRTPVILAGLQEGEGIPLADQITVTTITIDSTSMPHQRKRIVLSAGAGLGGVVLTLMVAAGVNGLSRRGGHNSRRRAASAGTGPDLVGDSPAHSSRSAGLADD